MIYYNKYDLVYDVVIRRRANLLGDAILSKIRDAIVDCTQTSRSSETKLSREIGSLINFDNATWIEPLACRPSWTFGYLPRPLLYDERDAIIYYIIISVITIFEYCIDGMIIYVIFLDISCSTVSRDKGILCGLSSRLSSSLLLLLQIKRIGTQWQLGKYWNIARNPI